jgi:O-antigen/teichoic acid export membrane protein
VGLYTLAYRVLEVAMVLGTVYLASVFPVLAGSVDRDRARARRVLQTSFDLLVVMGVPLVAGGLVLAPRFVTLAAGDDFSGAVEPLRILLAAGALGWVNGVFGYALIAIERQASALWLNVTGLTFNVGLNFLLVPRHGIVAAAIVTVASELVLLAGSYHLMRRHYDFFPVPRTLLPALVAAAAMAAAVYPIRDATLALTLPLALVVYGVLVYAASPTTRAVVAGVRRGAPAG